jgi:hypothetical protein
VTWWADAVQAAERGEPYDIGFLEHDVVPTPEHVREMEDCPEPWCLSEYGNTCHQACRDGWRNALGFTRFRSELIYAVPDAVESMPDDLRPWSNMCDGIGGALRAVGWSHHWHAPILHTRQVQTPDA